MGGRLGSFNGFPIGTGKLDIVQNVQPTYLHSSATLFVLVNSDEHLDI